MATRDLAVEWAKHAHVDVVTSSYKGLKKFETIDNVNIYRVKILARKSRDAATFISMLTYLPGAFIKGISLLRKNRYSVINTHFVLPSGPVGWLLGKIFKIPNIVSLHGGELYDPSKKLSAHKSRLLSVVVRYLLNKSDAMVAQSGNTRENAIKYYNPKKAIQIIPLPFHAPVLPGITRKDLNLSDDDFILITCGRLIKRKAIDVIIRALAKIESDKFRLLILGDGPEKQNLENLVSELNIGDRVTFFGFVDEIKKYQYLSTADVFSLASLHEGFGIVYMEAMFCGLPIICSDTGGQTDFLKHRENALIIKVGDINTCRDAILELHKNKKLYMKLSKKNKEKVKDFYAKSIAERYMDLFKSLTSGEYIGN